MGLGIAIAGGIICATVLAVFSIVFSTSGQIYEINYSRTHAADLQNVVFQTNMTVSGVTAKSGNQFVNFTLTNTGNEKLWNYKKFDIIINYTANVLGLPTQRAESITYTTDSVSCGPDGTIATNNWIINNTSNDYTDPNIVNTNERALICTKLAYPVYTNGGVKVTVSTDSGHTKINSTTAT